MQYQQYFQIYLNFWSPRSPKSRKRKICVIQGNEGKVNATIATTTDNEQINNIIKSKFNRVESVDNVVELSRPRHAKVSCNSCHGKFILQNDIYQLKRKVFRQQGKIRKLNTEVRKFWLKIELLNDVSHL